MLISERRLQQHLLIHNNTIFKCSFEGCSSERNLKASINSHFREKHGKVNHRKSMAERYKTTANEKVTCTMCKQVIKKKSLNNHVKSHENKESTNCIFQSCSELIYWVKSTSWHSFNLPQQFYKHLEITHNVDLNLQKVCVEFKCKHCSELVFVESAEPQVKRIGNRNAKYWPKILSKHITENHSIDQNLDIKRDWESHYDRGSIFLEDQKRDQ